MSATLCQRQVRLLIFLNGPELAADGVTFTEAMGSFTVFFFYSLPHSWSKTLKL